MLEGHDIVYLAGHDFALEDSRISTDHIAQELARHNRLLYVESIGLRRPKLNTNDLSRIGRKLSRFLRPPRAVSDGCWVFTPLAVPLHDSRTARRLNRVSLPAQVRLAAARLRFRRPILILFLPSMHDVVGRLHEAISVYYCTDEHAAFPGVDADAIRTAEDALLRKVTIAFATSDAILEAKRRINPRVYYSPHGVDFEHFARAQDATLVIPEELADAHHPIVGYFGAIDEWLDIELLNGIAGTRPDWTFVFIGKPVIDVSRLARLPNVRFLGPRPFVDLPRYGRAFDVAIIPFRITDLTRSVSPIKLKEYLAMGKPVVSTGLPSIVEFRNRTGVVDVGNDATSIAALIDRAIAGDSRAAVEARQAAVQSDTWSARVAELGTIIERHLTESRHSIESL